LPYQEQPQQDGCEFSSMIYLSNGEFHNVIVLFPPTKVESHETPVIQYWTRNPLRVGVECEQSKGV